MDHNFDISNKFFSHPSSLQESDDIASRAVLKQEQVTAAKGRIVIKSICTSDTGICQCDINLKEPSVTYLPAGYDSIVLDNVNQVSKFSYPYCGIGSPPLQV